MSSIAPAAIPARPSPKRRRIVMWCVRIAVSASVLAVIFHLVPLDQVIRAGRKLSPLAWLAALALFLCGHALAAAKWRLLIGSDIPLGAAFRAHLAGLGANLALPGVAGGDLVRATLVAPWVRNRALLAVGSLADRVIDTLGLLLMALAGSWLVLRDRYSGVGLTLLVILAASVAGAVGALIVAAPLQRALARRGVTGKIGRLVARVVQVSAQLARRPFRLLACLLLSMFVQSLFVGINIGFAREVGLKVPAAAWLYAWSTAKIIAIAPISFGGLGVREASMAALLRPLGAAPGEVIAVGLLWQTVLYASGVLGIVVQSLLSGPARAALSNKSTGTGLP